MATDKDLLNALSGAQPLGKAKGPIPIRRRLNPMEEFQKVKDLYPDLSNDKANFLIIGAHGTGKTYSLLTAPGPVVIDSFDPGGTRCIPAKYIESGQIMVRNYEFDTAVKPQAFRTWEADFNRWKNGGMFDSIGTYAIDFTRWAQSLMHAILEGRGRKPLAGKADLGKDPDIVPELGDYNLHQKTLAQYLADITNLPCHVVVMAHLNIDKDEKVGRMFSSVYVDGKKFAQNVPSLFDEVYFAEVIGQNNFVWQLVPRSYYPARSRLRSDGVLKITEGQDFRSILKRAGYYHEDRQLQTT